MSENAKPAVSKGKISALHDGGKMAEVKPYTGEVVTVRLVVPFFLFECLTVGMEVIYAAFDDNTGAILARMDGEWNHDLKGMVKVEQQVQAQDFHSSAANFNGHTHTCPDGSTGGPQ